MYRLQYLGYGLIEYNYCLGCCTLVHVYFFKSDGQKNYRASCFPYMWVLICSWFYPIAKSEYIVVVWSVIISTFPLII